MGISHNNEQRPRRQDDVEIPVPWSNIPLRIPSKLVAASAVIVAVGVTLGWMIRDHDLRTTRQLNESVEQAVKQADKKAEELSQQQAAMNENIRVMAFILASPESERKKIRDALDMPPTLRRLMTDRAREREADRFGG